jgi:Mg-chelatase subunit ChlD
MRQLTPTSVRRFAGRGLALCCLAGSISLAWGLPASGASNRQAAQSATPGPPASDLRTLAFVSDDHAALYGPGCDAISLIDSDTGEALVRGEQHVSPGRLAATSDGTLVVSVSNNNGLFLYVLAQSATDPAKWNTTAIVLPRLLMGGPLAISPDDKTLLLPMAGALVEKYDLAPLRDGKLGSPKGQYAGVVASAILFSRDSRTAFIAGVDGTVHVVNVSTMSRADPTIPYVPVAGPVDHRLRRTFAALSPDGQYLVINTGNGGKINVLDTTTGASSLVTVPGMEETYGLAFNYAPRHQNWLAIHGHSVVGVYQFEGASPPRLLASESVPPQQPRYLFPHDEIYQRFAALAWSGGGDALIAAIDSPQEWRILDVEIVPDVSLRKRVDFDSCVYYPWLAAELDVLTLNDRITYPTPTPTATEVDTPTATAAATATASPTASATPSLTATPRPTATIPTPTAPRPPRPLYLPLALREQCVPGKQRVDVALVIDASTSMVLDRTSSGRTKLDAATEAARGFLGLLALPNDQATLIAFNSTAAVLQELTGNRALLDAAFARITVARQTRIHLGVELARQELASPRHRAGNQPVMIVLTDGKANPESPELAVQQAQLAKADGIAVFTIGLGADADLDVDALQRMASQPSYYYHAPDADQLKGIYSQIAVAIPCPPEGFWGRR